MFNEKFKSTYKRKEINSWTIFNQLISPPIWQDFKKTNQGYADLGKQDKLEFSRVFRLELWEAIKKQVYNELEVEPQDDPKKKQKDEKHPVFRKYLDDLVEKYAQMKPPELVNSFSWFTKWLMNNIK